MITELILHLMKATRKFIRGKNCGSCKGLGRDWVKGCLQECKNCNGKGRRFPWEPK